MTNAHFTRSPEGIEEMGIFCAALFKAGVAYNVRLLSDTTYIVNITGF